MPASPLCKPSDSELSSVFRLSTTTPEHLRADLHGIRATLEANSKTRQLDDARGQLASGLMVNKGQTWDLSLRVTSAGASLSYKLDRWD